MTAARAERHLAEPRVVFEDDTLPRQIRLVFAGSGGEPGRHWIGVSCTCMRRQGGSFEPLESRKRWEPGTDIAVWRAHVEAVSGP